MKKSRYLFEKEEGLPTIVFLGCQRSIATPPHSTPHGQGKASDLSKMAIPPRYSKDNNLLLL